MIESSDTLAGSTENPGCPREASAPFSHEQGAWFKEVMEFAPYGFVVSDREGRIVMVNPHAEQLFGYGREEFLSLSVDALVPDSKREKHSDLRQSYCLHPEPRSMGHGRDLFARRKDGTEFPVEISLTPLRYDSDILVLSTVIDITKRKKLEADVLRISEDEKYRIGQDLHDDLCSQLSGIGCLAKSVEETLKKDHFREAETMTEITAMISAAGKKARAIAKGLVPVALETDGLPEALVELAHEQQILTGVACTATVEQPDIVLFLKRETAIQIYRIAQEGVRNAVKHGKAERVRLSLVPEDSRIVLRIEDDGVGMSGSPETGGLGLFSMRRRADLIEADFVIHTTPGRGTTIECSVPFCER
ncbi:MAG: PAS domain S-box protein [Verrucomicrobiales bacterium]